MHTSSRRKFIQTSAAASASLPLFSIGQSAPGANSKLNMAVIGVAGMGGYATSASSRENLVALCDVDEARAAKTYNKHANVPKFKDFRVMMDKMHKDIDAVCISTPDHTHFAAAMAAMERGKHVFVQKPLATTYGSCAPCTKPLSTTKSSPRWAIRATPLKACAASKSGSMPVSLAK